MSRPQVIQRARVQQLQDLALGVSIGSSNFCAMAVATRQSELLELKGSRLLQMLIREALFGSKTMS
jgi:hypothetical protein